MKTIDIDKWERKEHFQYFNKLDYPHFNVCSNLEISSFLRFIRETKKPFFISLLFAATKAANSVEALRYRIREKTVIEHERVHPSFTVMAEKGVFNYCSSQYTEDFQEFSANTAERIEAAKVHINIKDRIVEDDVIYITSLPWVSFTSVSHPIHMKPVDCIPRITWGKYFEENQKNKLPVSIQAHHALVDGAHVGQFFLELQRILDYPEKYLH